MPYIVIGLAHEERANFYGEKRRVAFLAGHVFTFSGGFISHPFGDYANINIWESHHKNDFGRFVKNKRYQETGMEYFTIVQMIMKDEGY